MPSLSTNRPHTSESGFSLLEAVLAIGILSVVVIQIVNVQSASMEITAVSRQNQIATWALRSANAQLQYVLDVYGVEGLRPYAEFSFGPDKDMTVTVETAETKIEASRLFLTASRMAMLASGGPEALESDESKAFAEQFKQVGETLDSQIPSDIYRTIKVTVAWKNGEQLRTMEGGYLIVDDKALTLGGGLASFGAGGLPPGVDGDTGDTRSDVPGGQSGSGGRGSDAGSGQGRGDDDF